MRIVKISVYQVDLPHKFPCCISGGRQIDVTDSTIVSIESDTGLVGWGEGCPFGNFYLPFTAESVRAGVNIVAPPLIGADPTNINAVNLLMDQTLIDQIEVKHILDMACWDLLGKHLKAPLHQLLGGLVADSMPRTSFLSREMGWDDMAEKMVNLRHERRPHFEVKAIGDPAADIELINFIAERMEPWELLKIDANRGWKVHEAHRVMSTAPETAIIYEQPCMTYEECKALRQLTNRPIFLDEVILDLQDIVRSFVDGVANGINLKIQRVGGLSKTKALCNLCEALGLPIILQCVGGSDITDAAIAHMGHTIRPGSLLSTWDASDMLKITVAEGMGECEGRVKAGEGFGLGVEPLMDVLGTPIFEFE